MIEMRLQIFEVSSVLCKEYFNIWSKNCFCVSGGLPRMDEPID